MSSEKPAIIPQAERYPTGFYPEAINVQAGYGQPPVASGINVMDYWRVLVTRRWTIASILLTSMVVTFIWTLKQTPIYQAGATIEIDRENSDALPFKDSYETRTSNDDMLRTQYEILHSRTLARKVVEDLHLEKSIDFKPEPPDVISAFIHSARVTISSAYSSPKAPEETAIAERDPTRPLVDSYLGRLTVTPVRQARLVRITFESRDPELASRVINAHAEHFIEQNFQFKLEDAQRSKQFLSGQLVTMKAEVENSQDALQKYSRDNEILFTQDGKNTATEKLQQLDQQQTSALADRARKESNYKIIQSAKPEELLSKADSLPQVNSNPTIAALTAKLTQLQHDDALLAVDFEPAYLPRQRVRAQIVETEKNLRDEKTKIVSAVQAEYQAAVDNEAILEKELKQQKETVNRINQDIIQYNIRKGEADSNKTLYTGLLNKLNEADVSSTLHASNIRIVDKAETPSSPIRPRKSLNMLLSLVVGLAMGVGMAFFQDYLDDSIKSTVELSRLVNLPSLGVIPKLGSLGRRGYGYYKLAYGKTETSSLPQVNPSSNAIEIIAHEAPMSVLSEAYRSIRTSLMLSSADHAPRTILVTSAVPSEGKTVTAVNTAISLSQLGGRVVIVDADMRKPRIHAILKVPNSIGLSALLTGAAPIEDVVQITTVPNLFVIPCGVIPPNPSELLVSRTFQQMLAALSQQFDYVVIDSPPVNLVSDARILGSMVDRIVLVVRALSTSRHQVQQAVDHLSGSRNNIAGIVLNDLDAKRGSYYSGQYYSGRYYGTAS